MRRLRQRLRHLHYTHYGGVQQGGHLLKCGPSYNRTINVIIHLLIYSDYVQDGDLRDASGRVPALAADVTWTTMGFGADHDAELLAEVARGGRGSFTYVETGNDATTQLDSAMSAYLGAVTYVQAADVRMRIIPTIGVTIDAVRAPGVVTDEACGVKAVALGYASASATREILITLTVPAGITVPFILMCSAAPATDATGERVDAVAVAAANATPTTAEAETLHLAINREHLAVAATAVANSLRDGRTEQAVSVIRAARSVLVGSESARTPVGLELTMLSASLQQEGAAQRAWASAATAATQMDLTFNSPCVAADVGAMRTFNSHSAAKRPRV